VLLPADQVEYCKSLLVTGDGLAVDQAEPHRQFGDRRRSQREAIGEVVTVAGDQAYAAIVAPGHDPEAVVLDLVNPVRP
jgi:hypothetical protein